MSEQTMSLMNWREEVTVSQHCTCQCKKVHPSSFWIIRFTLKLSWGSEFYFCLGAFCKSHLIPPTETMDFKKIAPNSKHLCLSQRFICQISSSLWLPGLQPWALLCILSLEEDLEHTESFHSPSDREAMWLGHWLCHLFHELADFEPNFDLDASHSKNCFGKKLPCMVY